jgi:hypothetical protein
MSRHDRMPVSEVGENMFLKVFLAGLVLLVGMAPAVAGDVRKSSDRACDVALILVLDVSTSINDAEFKVQIEGTAAAFRDKDVIGAIKNGMHSRIAVAMVFFADVGRTVMDWSIIENQQDAVAVSERIGAVGRSLAGNTSIDSGLSKAAELMAHIPCVPDRRVVDVSGDGVDHYCYLGSSRDALIRDGVIINAISVGDDDRLCAPTIGGNVVVFPQLRQYYDEHVRGGEGSFAVSAPDFDGYVDVIRSKILREIS